jgi:hypothetical protein
LAFGNSSLWYFGLEFWLLTVLYAKCLITFVKIISFVFNKRATYISINPSSIDRSLKLLGWMPWLRLEIYRQKKRKSDICYEWQWHWRVWKLLEKLRCECHKYINILVLSEIGQWHRTSKKGHICYSCSIGL